jgi:MmyB-like transcription regulator ligand binding domain
VQFHRTGRKRLHHPVVGDLDLTYEAMEFPPTPA